MKLFPRSVCRITRNNAGCFHYCRDLSSLHRYHKASAWFTDRFPVVTANRRGYFLIFIFAQRIDALIPVFIAVLDTKLTLPLNCGPDN